MSTKNEKKSNNIKSKDSLTESIKVLTELTQKDIKRSYNIDDSQDTEVYYSNRYGWSLRKTFD